MGLIRSCWLRSLFPPKCPNRVLRGYRKLLPFFSLRGRARLIQISQLSPARQGENFQSPWSHRVPKELPGNYKGDRRRRRRGQKRVWLQSGIGRDMDEKELKKGARLDNKIKVYTFPPKNALLSSLHKNLLRNLRYVKTLSTFLPVMPMDQALMKVLA